MKGDIDNIKEIEQNSLTDFQKHLHIPEYTEDEVFETEYTNKFPNKTPWKSTIIRELEIETKEEKTVYKVDSSSFDILEKTVMILNLPELKLKNEFVGTIQICWIKNLLHNIYSKAVLLFDSDPKQTLTRHTNTIDRNYLFENDDGKRDQYLEHIGNRESLTNWTSTLYPEVVNAVQRFYFSEHRLKAIPLFMCPKSAISFEYFFTLDLAKLVRIRRIIKTDENEIIGYKYIEFKSDYFVKLPDANRLVKPKIRGEYLLLSEYEKDFRRQAVNGGLFLYDDFIQLPQGNKVRLNSRVIVSIQNPNPCKAIFIIPENTQSSAVGDYSDFTYEGFSVIKSLKVHYMNQFDKIPEIDNRYIEDILPQRFPSIPKEKGIGAIPISTKIKSISADCGIVPNGTMIFTLELLIDYTAPFFKRKIKEKENDSDEEIDRPKNKNKDEDEDEPSIKVSKLRNFLIHKLLMVTKEIKFDGEKCVKSQLS